MVKILKKTLISLIIACFSIQSTGVSYLSRATCGEHSRTKSRDALRPMAHETTRHHEPKKSSYSISMQPSEDEIISFNNKTLQFSTEKADYSFYHDTDHFKEKNFPDHIIKDNDIIVLETGETRYERMTYDTLLETPRHVDIVEKSLSLKKAIWFVDIPSPYGYTVTVLLQSLFYQVIPLALFVATIKYAPWQILLFSWPLAIPGILLFLQIHFLPIDIYKKFMSYATISSFYRPSAVRSAIAAKKIEESLVPAVSERIKRRPKILIIFGKNHSDMMLYAKNKKLRDRVYDLHRKLGFPFLDKDYIDKIGLLDLSQETPKAPVSLAIDSSELSSAIDAIYPRSSSAGSSTKQKTIFIDSPDIATLADFIRTKKEQLAGKTGTERPLMIVIDGDSCNGKTYLAKNIARYFRTHVIEQDKLAKDTPYILSEKDPGFKNVDPYRFWANRVNDQLISLSKVGNYEVVILEGMYALYIARALETIYGVAVDIRVNVQARDSTTRLRALEAKRAKGILLSCLDDKNLISDQTGFIDSIFLGETIQGEYSFPVIYDLVIENSHEDWPEFQLHRNTLSVVKELSVISAIESAA